MITVKRASPIHLQTLNGLFEQYRHFYSMPSANQQSLEFLKHRLHNQDSIILLAFQAQTAAGFLQVYPAFSSVALKPLWILNDLFVSENYRRLGIAKKLMLTIEAHAKSSGVFSIKLATQVDNVKAKALYDALGYKIIEQFDHYSKRVG